MVDCPPTYLLLYKKDELIARAAFWLVHNEPLPDLSPVLRTVVMSMLKHWPLFICRSPLSNATGLILQDGTSCTEVLSMLAQEAIREATLKKASIVVFDYLEEKETQGWPPGFNVAQITDPGTVMINRWDSLEDFLADGNKKDRQHYKRTLREAKKLDINLNRGKQVPDVESALALIRNVDNRHGNAPNPWMRDLLTHIHKVGGTWLEAYMDERLIGCGLILEDNSAQMTTALGLEKKIPYVYFMLVYASLEFAFQKKVHLLRWGSGAYEIKQRLGFTKLNDNYIVLTGTVPVTNTFLKLFSNPQYEKRLPIP
jgi:predicted N-acyltransferase